MTRRRSRRAHRSRPPRDYVSPNAAVVDLLLSGMGNLCHYCDIEMTDPPGRDGGKLRPTDRTVDHAVPLSRGGADAFWNKVLSCHACNCAKGSLTATEFAAMRLSEVEVELIRAILSDPDRKPYQPAAAEIAEHQPPAWRDKPRCRERDEAVAKLVRLGVVGGGSSGDGDRGSSSIPSVG